MVKVPRRDLDKHIQSSMLQHMTDMALSHTATKTQLTALKQEHEALRKDYTSLKEDHTELKEDNEAKMKATGAVLRQYREDKYVSTITSQLYTLLVDTSTMEMGNTLSLALSESNTESGHHYIILGGCKFKLEWESTSRAGRMKKRKSNKHRFISLYLVIGDLRALNNCEFTIIGADDVLAGVCCGKPQTRPNDGKDDLLGSTSLTISLSKNLIVISFNDHKGNEQWCRCNCHEEVDYEEYAYYNS